LGIPAVTGVMSYCRRSGVRSWLSRVAVDLDYEDKAPYAFTGTVRKVVFDLKPATHEEEKDLHVHEVRQVVAAGVAG
jgi:hypothetical protein